MNIQSHVSRRAFLVAAAGAASSIPQFVAAAGMEAVEVWKDPSCGCCKDWVIHLEANGFAVKVTETGNDGVRARLGIPKNLGSCHTALVAGYAIEGHVPAADIRRLLKERPVAIGLAVPGMPIGSPGMDGPANGGRKSPYAVLLVLKSGESRIFASHNKA